MICQLRGRLSFWGVKPSPQPRSRTFINSAPTRFGGAQGRGHFPARKAPRSYEDILCCCQVAAEGILLHSLREDGTGSDHYYRRRDGFPPDRDRMLIPPRITSQLESRWPRAQPKH